LSKSLLPSDSPFLPTTASEGVLMLIIVTPVDAPSPLSINLVSLPDSIEGLEGTDPEA
jgi:hypothetical protein